MKYNFPILSFVAMSFALPAVGGLARDGMSLNLDIPYCFDEADCKRTIDVVVLSADTHDISLESGELARNKSGETESLPDSLLNLALRTQADAVFSGGFIYEIENAIPLGGFKLRGNELHDNHDDWPSSAYVCVDQQSSQTDSVNRTLAQIGDFEHYKTGKNCIQSAPLLISDSASNSELSIEAQRGFPEGFWDMQAQRNVIATLTDGSTAFVFATNHSYGEVQSFLSDFNFNGKRINAALGLNGGTWSGYIARTNGAPVAKGDINFQFPTLFATFPR